MSDEVKTIVITATVAYITGGVAGGFSASGFAFSTSAATTSALTAAALTTAQIALAPTPEIPDFNSFSSTSQKDRQANFRQPITSRKLVYGTIKVGGPIIYISTTAKNGKANTYLHMIVAHASHEVNAISSWFIDGNEIPTSSLSNGANGGNVNAGDYSGKVRINPHLGADGQTADSDLIAEIPDEWTSSHQLNGIFYNYVRFEFDQDLFTSIPQITALVQGKKVFDPRTGTSGYSANSALVLRDYLTDPLGLNIPTTLIDDDSVISSANICDQNVDLKEGGTEKRYEAHGMIDTAVAPDKNIKELLSSMHGTLVYSNGKFKMTAGTTKTAVLSIDENDFASGIQISPRLSRRENFNAVKGQYVSPNNNYQPTDYPPITSTTFQTEDNGEQIFRELNMPFTTSTSMAQRVSKIALYKVRQPLSFQSTHRLSVLGLDVGDVANITFDRYGWLNKPFEVVSWNFLVDNNQMAIGIQWREYADSVYSWSTTEEQLLADAPNTNLPDVFNLQQPLNLSATENLVVTRDGRGVQSVLDITFDEALDAFATEYEMEFKKTTDTDYISGGRSPALKFEITDLAPAIYDIRVRSVSALGTTSSFSSITKEVIGLAAPPSDMTNLSIQQGGGFAFLQWDRSVDLDVRIGGKVEIRHSNVTSGATWMTSTLVDDSVSGIMTSAIVPLRSGTYLLKFVDGSGAKQVNATTVATEGATILNFVNNTTINEHTAFNGLAVATTLAEDLDSSETAIDVTSASNLRNNDVIKINDEQMLISSISSNTLTVVRGHNSTTATTHTNGDDVDNSFQVFKDDSDRLSLASGGELDDEADFDSIPNFDFMGQVFSSGTYHFATALDLTTSTRVRLQAQTNMEVFIANDLIDARVENINTWSDFDGTTDAAVGNIELYYQSSSDNITYSNYKKFTSIEEENRYFRFKAILTTSDVAYSVRATTLSVTADTVS